MERGAEEVPVSQQQPMVEAPAAVDIVTNAFDDEEPVYYDNSLKKARMARIKTYSRMTKHEREIIERRSTALRKSIQRRRSIIQAQIERSLETEEDNSQEKEDIRLETIAREGLKALYTRQLNVGKGMQRSPHIVPYRSIGTPDLKRDDSLLPKTFQFAKREKFRTAEEVVMSHKKPGNQPMVLPLALRAAYWNGRRWCGASATARQVAVDSGFKYLYQEVVESEKRRINCKGGQGSTFSILLVLREVGNLAIQLATKLNESTGLPKFDLEEQLNFNQEILSAYRDESTYRERLAAERVNSPEYEATTETERKKDSFGTNGFPLKACEDWSLRQLESILHSKASFRSMQSDLNSKLVQSLKAMQTARPYFYTREFGLKGGSPRQPVVACDPAATPRRANALRTYLEKCRWFGNLLQIAFAKNRHPTSTELFIINDIRGVMDLGVKYGLDEFTNLIQKLGKRKMDMDTATSEKALMHVHKSLQLDDTALLTNLIETRSRLPAYLERKENLVKQVIRDLEPTMFPQNRWADRSKTRKKFSYHRPKTPPSPKFPPFVPYSNQTAPRKKPHVSSKVQTARF
ncbi:hypothetical protein R1sor_002257 [Riccia sorocarpa]|uniref:Uncharacterized protein n=1 Tax=Riccia sorocarpa TaxID=122646 RepID=A0ABD3H1N8_9MARC